MNPRTAVALIIGLVVSSLYWLVAFFVMIMAGVGPCGLGPDASCEEYGPSWIGSALATIGPVGVLLMAATIYVAAVWIAVRKLKAR
jgi:hypothetical protein